MDKIPAHGAPSVAGIGRDRHPIHPMLIPYPIAFLTGALATDLVALRSSDGFWPRASYELLRAGIVTGLAAGVVGAVDFVGVRRSREHAAGYLHALGNVAALGLSALNAAMRDEGTRVTRASTGLSAVTSVLLGVTGWLGGELSYRYKIGVMESEEARSVPAESRAA